MIDKDINRLVSYWEKGSGIDILAARDIFENTKNYVTVLFHIHLAIEKIIKALYVQIKKEHAPYSHNLLYLAKSSGLDLNEKDFKLLSEINEFNIECRYPDEKFSLYKTATRKFTGSYLDKAEKFIKWTSDTLNRKQLS